MEENQPVFGGGAAAPSQPVDASGASRVEQPLAAGVYDATIIKGEIVRSKDRADQPPSQGLYASVNIQLNTEPSRNRVVFDNLQILLYGGEMVGTSKAFARNYTQPFVLGQLLDYFKLPSNALVPGPIEGIVGKEFRGVFVHEKDNRDGSLRLKLRKVIGAPTGVGFTAKATETKQTEDFS